MRASFDGELPFDPSLVLVCGRSPGCDFFAQKLDVLGATPLEALSCHATQLVLCDVQPTAMFGRVVKLKTLDKRPGLFGREGFIKGSLRMGDGLVKSQRHQLLEKIGCSEHRVLKGTRVSNGLMTPKSDCILHPVDFLRVHQPWSLGCSTDAVNCAFNEDRASRGAQAP